MYRLSSLPSVGACPAEQGGLWCNDLLWRIVSAGRVASHLPLGSPPGGSRVRFAKRILAAYSLIRAGDRHQGDNAGRSSRSYQGTNARLLNVSMNLFFLYTIFHNVCYKNPSHNVFYHILNTLMECVRMLKFYRNFLH